MRVIREKINRQGKREVTVVLDSTETPKAFDQSAFYKMGYPVEDVVGGHIILDAERVTWCSLGQEWAS
jgi:hypothetical protein